MKPFVIAVCHQKGGVAKTTTVSTLGASLAEEGYSVLLIDLDSSGNLTSGLGLNSQEMKKSAVDLLLGSDTLKTAKQSVNVPNLEIIPVNEDMLTAPLILSTRSRYEDTLRNKINTGDTSYDYILIDCPPSLNAVTITALSAANLAIIPTQCEYFSLQALSNVFKTITAVRANHNPNLHYRLLVTMFDRRGNFHTNILEYFKIHHTDALFKTEIGFDSKIKLCQTEGIPLTKLAPNTRAARQYRSLANEIITYV